MLKAADESSPRRSFASGDSAIATESSLDNRTTRLDPLGVQSFWGYSGQVNVHNGNLILSATDVTLPGKGIPISISRTYNSRAVSPSGHPFGYGWTYNVGMSVSTVDGSAVMYTDGDNTSYCFVKAKDGTYTSPVGVYLILRSESGVYTLEEESGTKYYFDTAGRLDKIKDTDGNITDITYRADGTISQMIDAAGRRVTFNYSSGRLSSITGSQIPTIQYGYDSNGNLTSVAKKNTLGTILTQVKLGYNSNHEVTSITDAENNVTTIGYTGGRVTRIQKKLPLITL